MIYNCIGLFVCVVALAKSVSTILNVPACLIIAVWGIIEGEYKVGFLSLTVALISGAWFYLVGYLTYFFGSEVLRLMNIVI